MCIYVTIVLLSTVPKYADHFISTPDKNPNLPPLLSSLYNDKYRELSPLDLGGKMPRGFLHFNCDKKCSTLNMQSESKMADLSGFTIR